MRFLDHVPGIVSWLRDFTGLPLGVYPNLGHLAGKRWRFDDRIGPAAYAEWAAAALPGARAALERLSSTSGKR